MAIEIKADWKTAEIKALMAKLQAPRLNQALSVAVNDTARQVERTAERLTSKAISQPLKRAKVGVWTMPYSTPKTLSATVRASGSLIPLKAFAVKETPRKLTARIWGKRSEYPGAFIRGGLFPNRTELEMGGHVMRRTRKNRGKDGKGYIEKLPGASIAEAFITDAVNDALVIHGQERMVANLKRQLDRYARSRTRA